MSNSRKADGVSSPEEGRREAANRSSTLVLSLSKREGSVSSPTWCAIHACSRGGVTQGDVAQGEVIQGECGGEKGGEERRGEERRGEEWVDESRRR